MTLAAGALLLSPAYRRQTRRGPPDGLLKTPEIATSTVFLVAAWNFFGVVFSRRGTPTVLTGHPLSIVIVPEFALRRPRYIHGE